MNGSGSGERRPELRVGDIEREAVAAQLREHYAHGRLTHDELDERLDACMAARTQRELDAVVADLPRVAEPVRRAARWGGMWRNWAATSVVVWGIWGVGYATGGGEQGLWPLWVSGPWGAAIVSHAIRGSDDPIAAARRQARADRRRLRDARRGVRRRF